MSTDQGKKEREFAESRARGPSGVFQRGAEKATADIIICIFDEVRKRHPEMSSIEALEAASTRAEEAVRAAIFGAFVLSKTYHYVGQNP
jgi:hypothetical protein